MSRILESLNPEQKEAVLQVSGQLLIVAGAGSGKTKTLAHRIAYLITQDIEPKKILAVTFTNKAALEMKERVYKILQDEKIFFHENEAPFIGTFHALGAYILRHHGSEIGLPRSFSILDEEDTRQIIKDLIVEFELNPEMYSPQRIKHTISSLKNELIETLTFAHEAAGNPYQETMLRLYQAYEARLQKVKGVDFDDLLFKTVLLLQQSKKAQEYWEKRWHYVHIDEYQDTNRAQYALSRILAHVHQNITVVGDIDQAIYSWRGADWRNILQFESDWPKARVITLEKNYRSTGLILEAANAVIINNKQRKEKNLHSQQEFGDPISLLVLENEKREALFIAEQIKHLVEEGAKPGSIAILFRTNAQSRAIEEAFLKKNIPYRLIAGVKFYERKEIKDVLAYLKFALNPDDYISQKRIINTPARGIGKVLLVKYLGGAKLSEKEHAKIHTFETLVEKVRDHIRTKKTSDALKIIIKEAGFDAYYKGNKLEEDRKENIKELLSVAKKFDELPAGEGIERLLTEASLSTQPTEVEDENSQVILLTAHAAKGLEFDIVIIAGMEEGLFPHSLSQSEAEIEEERRLFYVALTRARKKIIITLTKRRMIYGETSFNDPSRFLSELPEHLVSGSYDFHDYLDDESQETHYDENEITLF